jgi:hypothetical protein
LSKHQREKISTVRLVIACPAKAGKKKSSPTLLESRKEISFLFSKKKVQMKRKKIDPPPKTKLVPL